MTTGSTNATGDATSIRRRTSVALLILFLVLAGFVARLFDVQVVSADRHVADSTATALGATQELYGSRGTIVDQNGHVLAASIVRYDCQLDPFLIRRTDELAAEGTPGARLWRDIAVDVAAITGQEPATVREIVTRALDKNSDARYAELVDGVENEQYRALVELSPSIACVQRAARTYPDGDVAGNLLGFVGADGEPLEGLEKLEDDCLASTNGTRHYRQGEAGVIIPGTAQEQPAMDGGVLQLTIDRDLQWYMKQLITEQTRKMGAQSGAILVYEAKTGKVRAAAESSSVDPNDVDATAAADRGSKIFRSWFEPGSTFKALTAATVIDASGVTPMSTVSASGFEEFPDGVQVRDPFPHPTYTYTLAGVLADSSNVGISKFSEAVSAQTRYDYLQRFGIGEATSSYPGEQHGLVHPIAQWSRQTEYNTAFGQGLTTTMPELARAYGAIVNGGVKMPFTLIESCTSADGVVVEPALPEPERVIDEDTSAQMRAILENVFLTAPYAADIAVPGYRIGGKTGTGEKADPDNGGYKDGAYYATMVGFAPAEDPEYVVVVTLDEPTTVLGSAANQVAFRDAMTQVMKTYRVMPTTTVPEQLPKFG